jgi:hypothetical protein
MPVRQKDQARSSLELSLTPTRSRIFARNKSTDTIAPPLGLAATILDTGQNGRLLPTATRNRFYRLVPW